MEEKGRLKQYRGRLSPREIAEGMNAAAKNASRLAADAKILLDAKRFPSAASLAILAIEEAGKLGFLRGIATAPTDESLLAEWKNYRSHKAKNAAWIIMDLARRGATWLGDLKAIFDPDSDHPAVLDTVKQLGFYTDCYAKGQWSNPDVIMGSDLARMLVVSAELLCPKHETTEREIELWIEHVGPHWGTPEMFNGAIRFHAAMEKEGLGRHTPEEIEKFFFGPEVESAEEKPKQ